MRFPDRVLLLALAAAVAATAAPCPQAVAPAAAAEAQTELEKRAEAIRDSVTAVRFGRKLHALLLADNIKGLWAEFDERARSVAGGFDKFEKAYKTAQEKYGTFRYCLRDGGKQQEGRVLYNAYCVYSKASVPPVVRIAFTPEGKIDGLSIRDEAKPHDSDFADYRCKTELRLPVGGEWTVTAGGRTLEQNYHAALPPECFAVDFTLVKDGAAAINEGTANDFFYSFGQPVLAPAAGKVVWAADGVPDNSPGRPNLDKPVGNAIVIDHGNGEFSMLSHLKQWSVFVRVGQTVAPGDIIAMCGNSGAVGEPHVQYQLMNGPRPEEAECLPAAFVGYEADGQPVERGEPLKGQRVRNPE